MAAIPTPGKIITFYSYKGGTGRSMALANVGYLLAETLPPGSRGVLMIDWDLEAPGLHRYFEDSLKKAAQTAQRAGIRSLALQPGLIDFFESADSGYSKEYPEKSRAQALASLPAHVQATDFDNLHILKAGRFDDDYPERIRKFDWERFHGRDPGFFGEFRNLLMERYDYVLIDSRTGLTDTSGICVRQMPEKLVLVFVPNNQNIDGVLDVARRVRRFRIGSSDLRPLVSFPLASRIDGTNERLRVTWRNGGKLDGEEIPGYQKVFEDLFEDLYELGECDLSAYFDATQIKHDSDYAYGEKIAARRGTTDRLSLGYAFANFTRRLTTLSVPWEPLPEEQEIETAKRRAQAASAREEKARWKVRLLTAVSVVLTLLGIVAAILWLRGFGKSQAQTILGAAKAASDPLEQALLLTKLEDSSAPAGAVELARQVASTPIPILVLRGHTDVVNDISFSPDGSRLATASFDKTARIWKADGTGEPLVLRGRSGHFRSVAWSPNWGLLTASQRGLLTASDEVRLWDGRTGGMGAVVYGEPEAQDIIAATFDPADRILVVDRYGLHVWSATGEPISTTLISPARLLNVQFGSKGTFLAASAFDGTKVWSLESLPRSIKLIAKVPDDAPGNVMAVSPEGRYVVTSTTVGMKLWELWSLPQTRSYIVSLRGSSPDYAVAFSPDGTLLAVASGGTTDVYNLRDRYPLTSATSLPGGSRGVRCVAFSPDSKLLATASYDNTVRLWNLAWHPPSPNLDWPGLLKYLRGETKACLTDEQRARLLSETPKEAYEKYAACEQRYGRKAPPQISRSRTIPYDPLVRP